MVNVLGKTKLLSQTQPQLNIEINSISTHSSNLPANAAISTSNRVILIFFYIIWVKFNFKFNLTTIGDWMSLISTLSKNPPANPAVRV